MVPLVPGGDPRCNDSAYALSHPDTCTNLGALILKPGYATVCHLESVRFRVFEYKNGVETELTEGVRFVSSDYAVFPVGINSGNGTALGAGRVIITATDELGRKVTAIINAKLEDACCDDVVNATAIILDNSWSTSLNFSQAYESRLAFAKAAARRWGERFYLVGGLPKDVVSVWKTALEATQLTDWIDDADVITTAIDAVPQTTLKTNLLDPLEDAIAGLSLQTADNKVLFLISDGEHTSDAATRQQILDAANTYKTAGGIIVSMGLRAQGAGFDLLERISTGGFFLNANPDTEEEMLERLSYLKSVICAGQCVPDGDEYVNTPALSYDSLTNWEILSGEINLVGKGILDLLDVEGLYVELLTGTPAVIRTIDQFQLTSGSQYRVSFKAAGNQREDISGVGVKVYIRLVDADADDDNIFEQAVMPAWDSALDQYTFNFTAPFDATVRLYFSVLVTGLDSAYGTLIDDVKLEEVATGTVMLDDNFDAENLQYVPSPCGSNVGLPEIDPPAAPVAERILVGPTPLGDDGSEDPLIPEMTSATTPSGTASSSHEIAGNEAWRAMAVTGEWRSIGNGVGNPEWIKYQFGVAQTPTHYELIGNPVVPGRPTDWTLEGSNDNVAWTVLDARAGQPALDGSTHRYAIGTPGAYTYFRLTVTGVDNEGGIGYKVLAQFQILDITPPTGADQIYKIGATYVTNTGETELSATTEYTAENVEDVFKLTLELPTSDRVVAIRLYRTLGADPVESTMYLFAEIPVNQSVVLDDERRADFEARYDNTLTAPSSNTTEVPPNHVGYDYSECCYWDGIYYVNVCDDCLGDAPPAQVADANPLPDIETSNVPPVVYNSTKQVCVSCPTGFENAASDGLVPTMTSATAPSGEVIFNEESVGQEAWKAFDGDDATYWVAGAGNDSGYIGYKFAAATIVNAYTMRVTNPVIGAPKDWTFQGSNDGSSWTTLDTKTNVAVWSYPSRFSFTNSTAFLYYRINITATSGPATQNLNIYSIQFFRDAVQQVCATATATGSTQQSADAAAIAEATATAQSQLNCVPFWTATVSATASCAVGAHGNPQTVSRTVKSYVSQQDANDRASAEAQAAAETLLDCTLSNNNVPLEIPDLSLRMPIWSTKYVSGLSGLVTNVVVTMKLTSTFPDDLHIILRSPSGAIVELMSNCGGNVPIDEVELEFDDAAGGFLPDATEIFPNAYKPTVNGVGGNEDGQFFVAPIPEDAVFPTTLASLDGTNPNGSWAIFAVDDSGGGASTLHNWDIIITTA